jgi:hypothetical protein
LELLADNVTLYAMTGDEPRKHIWFFVKSRKHNISWNKKGTHDKTEAGTEMYATGETAVADQIEIGGFR